MCVSQPAPPNQTFSCCLSVHCTHTQGPNIDWELQPEIRSISRGWQAPDNGQEKQEQEQESKEEAFQEQEKVWVVEKEEEGEES